MAKKEETKKEEIIKDKKIDEPKKNNIDAEKEKQEYINKLSSDLAKQTDKANEYYEHLKRNMAEFDNFKKRTEKEKVSMYSVIISDVISGILPILDNFDKALVSETTDENYKAGIQMIYNSLKDYLTSQGLEEIEALNLTFDPNFHEAVMHEENEDYGEKEIIEVFRKGYKLKDRVIRHSMVKVAN